MVAIIYGFSMHNKHLASFLKGVGLSDPKSMVKQKIPYPHMLKIQRGGGRVVVPLTSVLLFYKRQKGLLRENFSLTIHTIKIRKGDIVD